MSTATAPTAAGPSLGARIAASPFWLKLLAGLVLFGLWEFSVRLFAAPFVVRPSGTIAALPAALSDPALWAASWSTLSSVFVGLAASLVFGVV
ncbi:MAG: hypothetical protein AB7J19_13330, partial [Beijerinckiaceae bacterium]